MATRSVVYITRMDLQKSSFQHGISSEDMNMSLFLRLPRELRDHVYDECFVAARPINLQNLAPLSKNSVSQCLCLAPNFLASCRQVHEEGMTKLYGENLYFVDLTSPWRFSRSLQWLKCFGLHFEQQNTCLVCQRNDLHNLTPDAKRLLESWNLNLDRVRRLQVSVQQYTYSQWKYRQPSAFTRTSHNCLHVPSEALREQLHLDLLVIRVLQRSLLSVEDSRRPSCWYTISQSYNVRDVELWKMEGNEDLKRFVEDVLQFAARKASNVIVSRLGRSPRILSETTMIPRYISGLLQTGRYFLGGTPCDKTGLLGRENFEGYRRAWEKTVTLARMSGSRVVCLDGDNVAFTSI